jgi:hypothetical protein
MPGMGHVQAVVLGHEVPVENWLRQADRRPYCLRVPSCQDLQRTPCTPAMGRTPVIVKPVARRADLLPTGSTVTVPRG